VRRRLRQHDRFGWRRRGRCKPLRAELFGELDKQFAGKFVACFELEHDELKRNGLELERNGWCDARSL
jgi:hypothetical protein